MRLGANLAIATLDQTRESLDPEATVASVLTEGRGDTVLINGQPRHVVGYMKDFLFRAEQARTPLKALSGGERGRLMLARALARPSNLLVLDEPTNDLDLETLDLLQEMLAAYPGTLLLVSHDRDFLDRVVTSVVASDGDGTWTEYAGGYSDMVAQRGRGIGKRVADRAGPAPRTAGKAAGGAASSRSRRKLELRRPARAEDAAGQDRRRSMPRSAGWRACSPMPISIAAIRRRLPRPARRWRRRGRRWRRPKKPGSAPNCGARRSREADATSRDRGGR